MKWIDVKNCAVASLYVGSLLLLPILPASAKTHSPVQTIAQATSITQFSDVQPSDYYFQALQSLIERWGVPIVGSPDGRFRGNQQIPASEVNDYLYQAYDRINELRASVGLRAMSSDAFQRTFFDSLSATGFSSRQPITRGQFAIVLNATLEALAEQLFR